ncbi:hypothetical protein MMC24_002524 [Lignoscripta atroalba]|nr:hypothetical protein [Lignoscripta atroalba]
MAYVPPHLRKKENVASAASLSKPEPKQRTFSGEDITEVFGNCIGRRGTLNATEHKPDVLAYVLLFAHPNPNYNAQGEVLTHTNLHLLGKASQQTPTTEIAESPKEAPRVSDGISDAEFALFKGHGKVLKDGNHESWDCLGWHRLSTFTYLEPRSEELAIMLDEKWKGRPRIGEKWEASLGMRWAKVKLEKVKGRELEDPMAAVQGMMEKTVNEMLTEMRLGNSGKEKEEQSKGESTGKDERDSADAADTKEQTPLP